MENITRIISIGRLEWINGYDYLLTAYKILKSRNVKFGALIIGEGSLKNELLFTIEDLDLTGIVRLSDKLVQREILEILSTSDIFVLSSHDEISCTTILEAMNIGIPVVSTNSKQAIDVIRDNQNGLLVPVRQPYALADAIEFLIKNPDERARFGMAGKMSSK